MSNFEDAGKLGKEGMDSAMKSFSAMTKGFQQIASESTEFTKRSYEQSARMFEQLAQSKSFDKVLELQNEYAKTAYQNWVSQATKMSELYSEIAKEVYKPFESSFTQAANGFQATVRSAA